MNPEVTFNDSNYVFLYLCLLIFNNGKKYENYVYIKMHQDNMQKYFINLDSS